MDAIAIIDLGGQYCHLISRRLRDRGIRSDIFESTVLSSQLKEYKGIILSGGPASVYDTESPKLDREIFELPCPILGICYGHQLLAQWLGAAIIRMKPEFGRTTLYVRSHQNLLNDVPSQTVWMSHTDTIFDIPEGMTVLGWTVDCSVAAFACGNRYGFQFHPEASHTENGADMLANFALERCRVTPAENLHIELKRALFETETLVNGRSVLFFVSGGVDSTVAFTLCSRVVPHDKLLGVYIDTGFMRKFETAEIIQSFCDQGLRDCIRIYDASERFLTALQYVIDPEEKRRIIGRIFVDIQSEIINELDGDWILGQGTIYPDTIESGGTSASSLIKTHHNRCPEIQDLINEGRVVEPIRDFYKDEVRDLGRLLGLPDSAIDRQPFPGPGLAIRCLCADDGIVLPLPLPGFDGYTAYQLPINSVGVQGDQRSYRSVVAVDGPVDYTTLQTIAVNQRDRVIAHIAGKTGPGYILSATITAQRTELLREADYAVHRILEQFKDAYWAICDHDDTEPCHEGCLPGVKFSAEIWQFPVVLIPLSFEGGETIVLRPVYSIDGMTASWSRLPISVLNMLADTILEIGGIDAVFLDITDKPPSTIEWE